MPEVVDPGAEVTVPLTITNTGALTWPAEGKKPVQISYHWMADDGVTLLVLEGRRTTLKDDVPSDTRINVVASVKAPERPGRYVIWWDLVHEGVTWFSDAGAWGYRQRVAVGTTPSPRKAGMTRTSLNMNTYDEFSRQKLWYAGLLAFRDHPLLGIGPDNFRHAYGHYLGREQTDDRLHANNFYIEVLATLGLAGLAAFIAPHRRARAHGAARGRPARQSRAGVRARRGARGLPGARHARLLPGVHADLRAAVAAGGRAGRARTPVDRAQPRGRQRARSRNLGSVPVANPGGSPP